MQILFDCSMNHGLEGAEVNQCNSVIDFNGETLIFTWGQILS